MFLKQIVTEKAAFIVGAFVCAIGLAGAADLTASATSTSSQPGQAIMSGPKDLERNYSLQELNDLWKIQQVMGTYTRAVDRRDSNAVACFFTPDGIAQIMYNNAGKLSPIGGPLNREDTAYMVSDLLLANPDGSWEHHLPADPVIELRGDTAVINQQLIILRSNGGTARGDLKTGAVQIIETGYYQVEMRRIEGVWKMHHQLAIVDIPLKAMDTGNHPPIKLDCP